MNRRDLIKSAAAAGVLGLSLFNSKLIAEEKTREDFIKSKLHNGIDKIFTVNDLDNNDRAKYLKAVPMYDMVPRFGVESLDIVDVAWHTVIAASMDNAGNEFPSINYVNFIETKATDVFVDSSIYKYVKHLNDSDDREKPLKIHSVDLAKYYSFFTDNLRGRFSKYTSNLIIACNLTDKNAALIPITGNMFGITVYNKHFMIGQV